MADGIPLVAVERFWSRVAKADDGCWLWTGRPRSNGYGQIRLTLSYGNQRTFLVHRLSYELLVGPIPDGLQIDHLCRNRACVNPAHLEAVSNRENVLRGLGPTAVNAAKTRCVRGHEFDFIDHQGRRACRRCARAHVNASYRRRMALREKSP